MNLTFSNISGAAAEANISIIHSVDGVAIAPLPVEVTKSQSLPIELVPEGESMPSVKLKLVKSMVVPAAIVTVKDASTNEVPLSLRWNRSPTWPKFGWVSLSPVTV